MITPEEYIERKPKKVWMHIMDLLPHILQGDYNQTAYKDPHPDIGKFEDFRKEMAKHVSIDNLTAIYEETYRRSWKWTTRMADGGDLVVENYIAKEELCFDEWIKTETRKTALTILMDINIPITEKDGTEMKKRHEKIYKIVAEAESQSQPCRVIAVAGLYIPEIQKSDMLTMYFIIKDYDDPIFSGIWGALKTNGAANNFCNAFSDFLIGTKTSGNGSPRTVYLSSDFEEDEVKIIDAKRIKFGEKPKEGE